MWPKILKLILNGNVLKYNLILNHALLVTEVVFEEPTGCRHLMVWRHLQSSAFFVSGRVCFPSKNFFPLCIDCKMKKTSSHFSLTSNCLNFLICCRIVKSWKCSVKYRKCFFIGLATCSEHFSSILCRVSSFYHYFGGWWLRMQSTRGLDIQFEADGAALAARGSSGSLVLLAFISVQINPDIRRLTCWLGCFGSGTRCLN